MGRGRRRPNEGIGAGVVEVVHRGHHRTVSTGEWVLLMLLLLLLLQHMILQMFILRSFLTGGGQIDLHQ